MATVCACVINARYAKVSSTMDFFHGINLPEWFERIKAGRTIIIPLHDLASSKTEKRLEVLIRGTVSSHAGINLAHQVQIDQYILIEQSNQAY